MSNVEMESIGEMFKLLEAVVPLLGEASEEADSELKPMIFVGLLNEKLNEPGFIRLSIIVCSCNVCVPESNDVIRCQETFGIVQTPNEYFKDVKEAELFYKKMKNDYDTGIANAEKRRDEIIKVFTDKGYVVFRGVII